MKLLKWIFGIGKSNSVAKEFNRKKRKRIEAISGMKIKDAKIFIEALTHRSVLDDERFKTSNERLEFLGDAILNFVVADYLFEKFPLNDEGFLTKVRANFVNKNTLYEVGETMKLFDLIFVNKELVNHDYLGKKSLLADTLEALIGAIYLDAGFERTYDFIRDKIIAKVENAGIHLIDENFKSQLLEFAQAKKINAPRYIVLEELGPEHDRTFLIEVRVGENISATGKGKNKKSAEQEAAKDALQKLEEYYSASMKL